jgi:NADH-quinone oxidoreductase subunit L
VPPLSGFFSKDEIISQAFLREDYGLWVVGIVAAGFTAVYMTRLIRLTFYGNERFELAEAVGDAPATDDESADADPAPAPAAVAAAAVEDPDSDPSPTVAYGTPVTAPAGHAPHESPAVMVFPVAVLAVLAAVGGLMNLPFASMEWLDKWHETSFRGVPEVHPDTFIGGLGLELLTFAIALGGILFAYSLYRNGLERPERDPLDERLGRLAPVLGNAYYYDHGIARLVGGPGRAVAGWLDRVVDTKVIDGTVNGVGSLVALLSRGVQQLQDGHVRRYALAITVGVGAMLLYVVIWLGR